MSGRPSRADPFTVLAKSARTKRYDRKQTKIPQIYVYILYNMMDEMQGRVGFWRPIVRQIGLGCRMFLRFLQWTSFYVSTTFFGIDTHTLYIECRMAYITNSKPEVDI